MANIKDEIKELLKFSSSTKAYFEDVDVNLNECPFEKKRRIAKLEKEPIKWMHYYFKNFLTCSFSKHHREFINYAIDNDVYYTVLSAFRGFGKSVLTTILLPAYLSIVKRDAKLILIIGNTYEKAQQLLLSLQSEFCYNKLLLRDYGTQSHVGDSRKGNFSNAYAKFVALGMQTSVRGIREGQHRPDLIICDDLDTMSKNITEKALKKNIDYITKDLWGTFGTLKGSVRRFILSNNLFSKNTITYRLTEICKKNNYKTFKINLLNDKGQSNWKQAIPMSEIKKIQESRSKESFLCEYMNKTAGDDDNMFNIDDLTFVNLDWDINDNKVITYIDPSYTDKGDYKAVVSIILLKDGGYYLDDVYCSRGSYRELSIYLTKVCNKYNYHNEIWIEHNNGSDLIKKEIKEYNKDLKIYVDRTRKGNKEYRISKLQKYFKNNTLKFNKEIEKEAYLEQLLLYPNVNNDDFPDALEGAIARALARKTFFKPFSI